MRGHTDEEQPPPLSSCSAQHLHDQGQLSPQDHPHHHLHPRAQLRWISFSCCQLPEMISVKISKRGAKSCTDPDEGGVHADAEALVVSAADALLALRRDRAVPRPAAAAPVALRPLRPPPEECTARVAAARCNR